MSLRDALRATLLVLTGMLVACSAGGPSGDVVEGRAAVEGAGDGSAPMFPPRNRPDVRGVEGAVSSDHPLATAVGYEVLRSGGNAVDAAVAMAGVLAVVRPHMNGVGGDAFALIYDAAAGRVYGLNGSGRAGSLATPGFFEERGLQEVPEVGALSVTVPGAVAAWVDALERFGTRSLAELLEPAIRYAREGFPVSTRLREDMAAGAGVLNEAARRVYLPGGTPPAVGSRLQNPRLASTLERIAHHGKSGFYEGPVAASLAGLLEREGGHIRLEDFTAHTSTWVEPLEGSYLGHRFLVLPPNSQGVAQLQLMGMAATFDLAAMGPDSPDYFHVLIELKKLAFADRDRWVSDPEFTDIPLSRLLDPEYLVARAGEVRMERAAGLVEPGWGQPLHGPLAPTGRRRMTGTPCTSPPWTAGGTL